MHCGMIDDRPGVWLPGGAVTEDEFRLTPKTKVTAGLLRGLGDGHSSDGGMQLLCFRASVLAGQVTLQRAADA